MADVTELLEQDHREVEALFARFEETGDRRLALQICDELAIHTAVEEEVVYPVVARDVDTGLAQEGKREHDEVDRIMTRIKELPEDDGRLRTFVAQLKDAVMHHVEEEEEETFPKMRAKVGDQLVPMGEKAARRKEELAAQGGAAAGDGNGDGLLDLTRDELYEQAKEAGVEGRSKMSKEELARALQRR